MGCRAHVASGYSQTCHAGPAGSEAPPWAGTKSQASFREVPPCSQHRECLSADRPPAPEPPPWRDTVTPSTHREPSPLPPPLVGDIHPGSVLRGTPTLQPLLGPQGPPAPSQCWVLCHTHKPGSPAHSTTLKREPTPGQSRGSSALTGVSPAFARPCARHPEPVPGALTQLPSRAKATGSPTARAGPRWGQQPVLCLATHSARPPGAQEA